MADLREYTFGDWFSVFLKAIPAYLIAVLIRTAIPAVILATLYFLAWSRAT